MGRQGRWGSTNEQNGFNRGPWVQNGGRPGSENGNSRIMPPSQEAKKEILVPGIVCNFGEVTSCAVDLSLRTFWL